MNSVCNGMGYDWVNEDGYVPEINIGEEHQHYIRVQGKFYQLHATQLQLLRLLNLFRFMPGNVLTHYGYVLKKAHPKKAKNTLKN